MFGLNYFLLNNDFIVLLLLNNNMPDVNALVLGSYLEKSKNLGPAHNSCPIFPSSKAYNFSEDISKLNNTLISEFTNTSISKYSIFHICKCVHIEKSSIYNKSTPLMYVNPIYNNV